MTSDPMTMNDENRPPREENVNHCSMMSSVKAGAAVFGDIAFASEQHADHSLCYSPSPLVDRSNNMNVARQPVLDGKILNYDSAPPTSKTTATANNCTKKLASAPACTARPKTALARAKPMTKGETSSRPASAKLPTRRAVTQRAVFEGGSVNPIINNVRRSKEENMKERILSVAELREQRRQEREDVAAFNVKAEQTRREVIELRKKLSERFRQAKLDREQREREENLAKVEHEIQFKSLVHVEHKKTMKELEDARRRQSIDDRAKLRRNHRKGEEQMRLAAIQEDEALFEERHESSIALRTAHVQNAEKRRKSFAFRNGDARRIRELFARREADRMRANHESYELKWAGERDAEDYEKQLAQSRRDSLAFRNAEGRRIRNLENDMKSSALQDEHESFELKWAGERDAEEYKILRACERRDSLKFRGREAARHNEVMRELLSLAREREHESYVLKWAAENDAKQHMADQAELRRQSLAFRNSEAKTHRALDAEMKVENLNEAAKDEELKAACQRDVQRHREECAARDRASLCLRGKVHLANRMQEENERQLQLQDDHRSHLLNSAAWQDVNDYVKECKRRKRLSLAFRANEKRRQYQLEKQESERRVQQQHFDTQCRSDDARYVEMAKLKEKARLAIESFSHPSVTFGSNPFANLLE